METWAHAQALFDLLGRVREDHDRIRNIVVIGINSFGWTMQNRGLDPTAVKPYLRLIGPSGAPREWNDPPSADRIEGSATEFCQVVTQTRNFLDTQLHVTGPVVQAWLSIAPWFAGSSCDL